MSLGEALASPPVLLLGRFEALARSGNSGRGPNRRDAGWYCGRPERGPDDQSDAPFYGLRQITAKPVGRRIGPGCYLR